jgi:hypothetical protein
VLQKKALAHNEADIQDRHFDQMISKALENARNHRSEAIRRRPEEIE